MGLGDFFSSLAGGVVRDAVVEAAERGFANHANRIGPGEPAPTSVHYGWASRSAAAAVCAVILPIVAVVVLSVFTQKPVDGAQVLAPLLGAAAISVCIACYDTFVRRVEWNEQGVRFRNWNRDRRILWDDLKTLQSKSYPRHWRIGLRDGTGFGIVETMRGSRYFLSLVERRLQPESPEGRTGSKRRKRRQRSKKR